MTPTLDVALGLVFVFLVLSLLASAIAEALEHYFRYRADYLRKGIQTFLFDGSASLTQKLYDHPLIKSLQTPLSFFAAKRGTGPSYIPSRQFVLALLDVASGGGVPSSPPSKPPSPPWVPGPHVAPASATPVAHLMAGINANAQLGAVPEELASLLRVLANDAGGDLEILKTNLQQSFDASMDRVAGWYKRHAQFVLLCVGSVVAVVVNADTLSILHTLSNDQAVRAAVVAAAETYARENPTSPTGTSSPGSGGGSGTGAGPGDANRAGGSSIQDTTSSPPTNIRRDVNEVVSQLSGLGLPAGWRYYDRARDESAIDQLDADRRIPGTRADKRRTYLIEQRVIPHFATDAISEWALDWWNQLASHLLGWLFTAFAISFGAPFWFDTLNKIMVIRSTVKPREKSQEEGSEDRKQ